MPIASETKVLGHSDVEPLRTNSGWIVALCVIYLITGLIALSSVVFATVVTVHVFGIMMLISGAAEVINAFQLKSWGKFLLWLILGVLYIIAGFITFENLLLAAALLTLMLGVALVASGMMRIILAFSMRGGNALDLGYLFQRNSNFPGHRDPRTLAVLEFVYPWNFVRSRPRVCWTWLDLRRLEAEKTRVACR